MGDPSRGGVTVRGGLRGLAAALLLAGCASTALPLRSPVVVPGAGFAAVRGEVDLIVRAHIVEAGGTRREVGGASCKVTTSLYRTQLTTPARLVVPSFGPESPTLAIDCAAGELRGSVQRDISTYWRSAPGAWGYPGAGLVVPSDGGGYVTIGGAWGWGWGWGGSYPVFEYRNVSVPLK